MNVYIVNYQVPDGYGVCVHVVLAHTEEQARSISQRFDGGQYLDVISVQKVDSNDLTPRVIREVRYLE